MRVAICADMEGLSGVDKLEHCFPSWPSEYRHGVRMLIGDLEAAITGALSAGATNVALADWHYLGRNLPASAFPALPVRRLWNEGRPEVGPAGLGDPAAAVFVGVHAGAGNPEGFLSHTFWKGMSVLLDGVPVSEAVLWGLALGGAGIPVVATAGDQRAAEEASHLLPGVRSVAVKVGTSRTSAILRPPPDAREELTEAVEAAVSSRPPALTAPFPASATIRYGRVADAERAAAAGVGDRDGERDVSATLGSVHDLLPFLARGLLSTPLGTAPRLADRLSPRGEGSVARAATRCLVGLTGWIERREVRAWAEEAPDLYPRVGPSAEPDGAPEDQASPSA